MLNTERCHLLCKHPPNYTHFRSHKQRIHTSAPAHYAAAHTGDHTTHKLADTETVTRDRSSSVCLFAQLDTLGADGFIHVLVKGREYV